MLAFIIMALVLAAIAIAAIIYRFVLYPKKKSGGRKMMAKEYVAKKFEDLMGLRALLVIKKDSGILLYSYIPETDDDSFKLKDPEFISAVLNALRSLGKDLGFGEHEFQRIQFGEYHVVTNYGHHVQAVHVSRNNPSTITEDNLLLFLKGFEKKFFATFLEEKPYITVNDYNTAIELVHEIFDTFFIEGVNLLYDPSVMLHGTVTSLQKAILHEARVMFQKKGHVVPKLLFIDLCGQNLDGIMDKHTREEVFYAMYELFKQDYFKHFDG